MKDFKDRVAVVTGGASGLGAAMAGAFADEGMRVLVADIDTAGAEAGAAALRARGADAEGLAVDVGDPASLDALAERARTRFGGCDLLAANVGVQRIARFDAMTREEFAWLIQTNVIGTADTVRALLPLLRESAEGQVVLTGSINSLVAVPGLVAYATSKMAVLGLAEGLSLELAEDGIAVMALLPGGMATTHLQSSDRARPGHVGEAGALDPRVLAQVSAALAPTSEAIVAPDFAIRHLIPALREGRGLLMTHGPVPPSYSERIERIQAAIDRADEP
jgi:NAD(P)-dependent dehydrogenase (short-subunit alcohol dehydrogenase family)